VPANRLDPTAIRCRHPAAVAIVAGVKLVVSNKAAVCRPVDVILFDRSDAWATQSSRHTTLEAISTVEDVAAVRPSAVPA
jgi:hypothetical protein